MTYIKQFNIEDFNYHLPENRIAHYPLDFRENSKLLILDSKNIIDDQFLNVEKYISPKSLIFFNQTKVVQARILFEKDTGSLIEIFCLEPLYPVKEITQAFEQKNKVIWKCYVGGARKWKKGKLKKDIPGTTLNVEKISRLEDTFEIAFEWDNPEFSFAEVLHYFGNIPLPPYIKRKTEKIDCERYQTIYAKEEGSVAAPTAGLHFTDDIIANLKNKKKCKTAYLSLHVGAGTFKPVSSSIENHIMHKEQFVMNKETIEILKLHAGKEKIIAVGTTSLRTLESLYWLGVLLIEYPEKPLDIPQFIPYQSKNNCSITESMDAILKQLNSQNTDKLFASTSLMIIPGYRFRIVDELITNFHQPCSTLLLLVSAFIGDKWKEVYQHALDNNYRFLSYGDACFFTKKHN